MVQVLSYPEKSKYLNIVVELVQSEAQVDVGSIAGRKQKGLGLFIGSVRRFSSGAGSRRTRRAETRKCRVADTNTLLRFAFAIVFSLLFPVLLCFSQF